MAVRITWRDHTCSSFAVWWPVPAPQLTPSSQNSAPSAAIGVLSSAPLSCCTWRRAASSSAIIYTHHTISARIAIIQLLPGSPTGCSLEIKEHFAALGLAVLLGLLALLAGTCRGGEYANVRAMLHYDLSRSIVWWDFLIGHHHQQSAGVRMTTASSRFGTFAIVFAILYPDLQCLRHRDGGEPCGLYLPFGARWPVQSRAQQANQRTGDVLVRLDHHLDAVCRHPCRNRDLSACGSDAEAPGRLCLAGSTRRNVGGDCGSAMAYLYFMR